MKKISNARVGLRHSTFKRGVNSIIRQTNVCIPLFFLGGELNIFEMIFENYTGTRLKPAFQLHTANVDQTDDLLNLLQIAHIRENFVGTH